MKAIRIEPIANGSVLLVDVVCDCGASGLVNEATDEASFKHEIEVGLGRQDKVLVCRCGKKYRLHPQGTHAHVFDLGG